MKLESFGWIFAVPPVCAGGAAGPSPDFGDDDQERKCNVEYPSNNVIPDDGDEYDDEVEEDIMMMSILTFDQLVHRASSRVRLHLDLQLRRPLQARPDHYHHDVMIRIIITLRKSSISAFSTSAFSLLCFRRIFRFSWFGDGIATPFFIGFEGKKSFKISKMSEVQTKN